MKDARQGETSKRKERVIKGNEPAIVPQVWVLCNPIVQYVKMNVKTRGCILCNLHGPGWGGEAVGEKSVGK